MKQGKFQIIIKLIAQMAVMIALSIVITRFLSFQPTPVIRIQFGWLPIILIAYLHGSWAAGISWGFADLLGYLINSFGAPFHGGIPVSFFLSGIVLGFLIYRKRSNELNSFLAVLGVAAISLFLTSLWLSQLFGAPYWATVSARIIQVVMLGTLQFFFIRLLTSDKSYVNRAIRKIAM